MAQTPHVALDLSHTSQVGSYSCLLWDSIERFRQTVGYGDRTMVRLKTRNTNISETESSIETAEQDRMPATPSTAQTPTPCVRRVMTE